MQVFQSGSFSFSNIASGIIFGSIGLAALIYGKKRALWRPMVIGIVLMAYPYFFQGTMVIYLIGIGLIAALYFWRE